ncbi:hypothetical protein C809_02468 [Lachnospiraceae bacterium MD335]|nr:hypothetical protein C809_02468 [Lachnospiraceae bacterium MD335]
MKSLEKLEEQYQKELALAQKHKQDAEDLRREIELLKGTMINQKIKALNFSGEEYKKLMVFLNDKKGIMEAIELVTGSPGVKGDDGFDENKTAALH